jgi:hypothetical protein
VFARGRGSGFVGSRRWPSSSRKCSTDVIEHPYAAFFSTLLANARRRKASRSCRCSCGRASPPGPSSKRGFRSTASPRDLLVKLGGHAAGDVRPCSFTPQPPHFVRGSTLVTRDSSMQFPPRAARGAGGVKVQHRRHRATPRLSSVRRSISRMGWLAGTIVSGDLRQNIELAWSRSRAWRRR